MATIKPFRALLPDPARAADICELPYDVMSAAEARQMAEGRPDSFLHVSRPEIDLPDGTDPTDPGVYAKARENLNRLIAQIVSSVTASLRVVRSSGARSW